MTPRHAAGSAAAEAPHPDESVGPLERGFAVLRALADAPGGRLRASELARGTGLARSTVDRVATTLVEIGAVRAEGDGRELVLAPAAARLGGAYLRGSALPETLGPLARSLAAHLDESVSLAVADRDAVRFIVQVKRRRALSVAFRAGDALPTERCAPGALFAAGWAPTDFAAWHARLAADPDCAAFTALPRPGRKRDTGTRSPDPTQIEADFRARIARAAEEGWAEDDQLIEQGLIAVALPVRDPASSVACVLSVVSHTSRHTVRTLADAVLPAMRVCAARMTEALATRPSGQASASAPAAAASAEASASAPAIASGQASAPAPASSGSAPDPLTPAEPSPLDPTAAAKEQHGPGYLQSLARGISVLSALGAGGPGGMTLSEAAAATGLPRATARRALLTSARQGYVATDGHRFRALPRILELGYARLSQLSLGELAQPHLAEVVADVHESASMAVLDGAEIRYVARAAAGRIMSMDITIGTRLPAYATSMGRVLLADLPAADRARRLDQHELIPLTPHTVTDPAALARVLDNVAAAGWALVDQELEPGLRSIAVPVRNPAGRAVAAVNVSLHAARTTAAEAQAVVLPVLRTAAARISADLALISDGAGPGA